MLNNNQGSNNTGHSSTLSIVKLLVSIASNLITALLSSYSPIKATLSIAAPLAIIWYLEDDKRTIKWNKPTSRLPILMISWFSIWSIIHDRIISNDNRDTLNLFTDLFIAGNISFLMIIIVSDHKKEYPSFIVFSMFALGIICGIIKFYLAPIILYITLGFRNNMMQDIILSALTGLFTGILLNWIIKGKYP